MENITSSIETSQSSADISLLSISSNKIKDSNNFSIDINEKEDYDYISCPYCEVRIYYN